MLVVVLVGNGGEGEIRTPETREGLPVFKTGAIDHSATSPMVLKYTGIMDLGKFQGRCIGFWWVGL